MNDITRCPRCGVWYRVSPEILARAGGLVRCGRCGETFDARANFRTPDETAAPAPKGGEARVSPPPPSRGASSAPSADEGRRAVPPPPDVPAGREGPEHRLGEFGDLGLDSAEPDPAVLPPGDDPFAVVDEPFTIPSSEPLARAAPTRARKRPRARAPWIAGILVLAALLGASLLRLRPWTAGDSATPRGPESPGERLAARSDPRAFRITAAEVVPSRLHPRTALVVTGTLLNASKTSEPLPWLLVRLTDLSGRTVAEGAFLPAVYSPRATPALSPKTAVPFRVRVLAPPRPAAGFRIELCRGRPPRLLCR